MNCVTSTLLRMRERRKNEGLNKYFCKFVCFGLLVLGSPLSVSAVGSRDLLGCIFIHHTSFEILATKKVMNLKICFCVLDVINVTQILILCSNRDDNSWLFA